MAPLNGISQYIPHSFVISLVAMTKFEVIVYSLKLLGDAMTIIKFIYAPINFEENWTIYSRAIASLFLMAKHKNLEKYKGWDFQTSTKITVQIKMADLLLGLGIWDVFSSISEFYMYDEFYLCMFLRKPCLTFGDSSRPFPMPISAFAAKFLDFVFWVYLGFEISSCFVKIILRISTYPIRASHWLVLRHWQ